MTDIYRTPVNQYALKAAEAHAKLASQREKAAELEKQRSTLLCEINEGIAPLRVERERCYRHVELSHPDTGLRINLCTEQDMLAKLPGIIGSTVYAEAAERLLADAETSLRQNEYYAERAAERAAAERADSFDYFPLFGVVCAAVIGTSISCAIVSDWSLTRILFVFLISLTVNILWFKPFKKAAP